MITDIHNDESSFFTDKGATELLQKLTEAINELVGRLSECGSKATGCAINDWIDEVSDALDVMEKIARTRDEYESECQSSGKICNIISEVRSRLSALSVQLKEIDKDGE